MGPDDFEDHLRESIHFRSTLVELLHSSEQSLAIVVAAVARQLDSNRLAADLLALQQAAAADNPDPTRDRILNAVRAQLHLSRPD